MKSLQTNRQMDEQMARQTDDGQQVIRKSDKNRHKRDVCRSCILIEVYLSEKLSWCIHVCMYNYGNTRSFL